MRQVTALVALLVVGVGELGLVAEDRRQVAARLPRPGRKRLLERARRCRGELAQQAGGGVRVWPLVSAIVLVLIRGTLHRYAVHVDDFLKRADVLEGVAVAGRKQLGANLPVGSRTEWQDHVGVGLSEWASFLLTRRGDVCLSSPAQTVQPSPSARSGLCPSRRFMPSLSSTTIHPSLSRR